MLEFFQALSDVAKIVGMWLLALAAFVAIILGNIVCLYRDKTRI